MKLAITVIQQAHIVNAIVRASPVCIQQDGGEQELRVPSAEQVLIIASRFGIDRTCYARYAAMRWGRSWASQAACRCEALDQIARYCHDPEGLVDKIEVELRTAERLQE